MEGTTVRVKNVGLRGVAVADTKISFIDGEQGVLIYRGYRIEDLARNSSFPETAYLLLHGVLPNRSQLAAFNDQLTAARPVPGFVTESFRRWPREALSMDALQASVPLLAMADPELADDSREANLRRAVRLIARLPVVVAAWHRIRSGEEPLPPCDRLSHAANFLWMLRGAEPDEETARDLDVCLILHADHTFNASTFACREVISTRAHMYAGVAAGVGALSGSLHGGANTQVIKMLLELGPGTDVSEWVRRKLERGERIMGLGHAVYRTIDPRARFLKEMAGRLGQKAGQEWLVELSRKVEETAVAEFERRGKTTIKPNVDFYSAPVYYLMGIPADLMTPLFAVARIAGWCAHVIEEKFADAQEKPELYRPSAEYVGQYCGLLGCSYEPLENRP